MSRDVRQAFQKGTRSPDGMPGRSYWQNHARYDIAITAAPPVRTIYGKEQITYLNNSPDTLHELAIRLFMNIHKAGARRGGDTPMDYMTSGVHVDTVRVNGQLTPWDSENFFTAAPLHLATPMLPRDSVHLSFEWHYDVSHQSNREGMLDSTTYFLAYFYPRVAVYDDYGQWDTMPFTDIQEFYSDFNDYDVAITVPANYVVWGTGTLINAADVLQPEYLERFQKSFSSDKTIKVATKEDMAARRVTKQSPTNTWRFHAVDIPDMAFNLSDHYVWDAASVVLDSARRRRVSVQAAYNDTAVDFHNMVQYSRRAVDWLSRNWPGVPYPYEKTTVVEGLAGMEYPMMVNDESYNDTIVSRFVVEHEIAHTWFPFYTGTNESRYAFMDEGWATTFEYLIGIADVGQDSAAAAFRGYRVNGWINDPSPLEDLPIITPADALYPYPYGNNAYGKPALGFLALKDFLGDASFGKALHAFIDRWHGKHPIPWDLFNTFDDVTGQDLRWFWNSWYFTNGYIDIAIRSVEKTRSGYNVVLENVGGMPAPVDLRTHYSDGSTGTIHETSAIWAADQRSATVAISTRKSLDSLTLEGGIWVDADSSNNRWETHQSAHVLPP
jgi:hypothetical protein